MATASAAMAHTSCARRSADGSSPSKRTTLSVIFEGVSAALLADTFGHPLGESREPLEVRRREAPRVDEQGHQDLPPRRRSEPPEPDAAAAAPPASHRSRFGGALRGLGSMSPRDSRRYQRRSGRTPLSNIRLTLRQPVDNLLISPSLALACVSADAFTLSVKRRPCSTSKNRSARPDWPLCADSTES